MGELPGSNLEVQDNEKSTDDLTDDLNSYWLQLQTKLNLSESMNAVDLVYCPVFNTSSGGHFACVFLLPAISKAFHMDSLATCGLYELATQVLSPFFAFCLNAEASVIPLQRSCARTIRLASRCSNPAPLSEIIDPLLCFEGGLPKHENTKHRPVVPTQNTKT